MSFTTQDETQFIGTLDWDVYLTLVENYDGDAWLCGGAVVRALLGKPMGKDYDIFCTSERGVEGIVTRLKDRGWTVIRTSSPTEEYDEARVHATLAKPGVEQRVEVIWSEDWVEVWDIFDSFDIDICQVGWNGCDFEAGEVFGPDGFDEALGCIRRRIGTVLTDRPTTPSRVLRYYTELGFTFTNALPAAPIGAGPAAF